MRRKYLLDFQGVTPLGTPADDGSGIMLGVAVGGSTSHMGCMSTWRFLYPPSALLEGVAVANQGERVGAEDVYGALLTEKMMRKHQSQGFAIYDSTQWAKAKKQLPKQVSPIWKMQRFHWLYWEYKKARSLEKLAKSFGISPQGLRQTVDAYNDGIKNDKPDPENKMPDSQSPILKPPFYSSLVPYESRRSQGWFLMRLKIQSKVYMARGGMLWVFVQARMWRPLSW